MESVPIAVGLVGPGAVGRALLEQLRVEVRREAAACARQGSVACSLLPGDTSVLPCRARLVPDSGTRIALDGSAAAGPARCSRASPAGWVAHRLLPCTHSTPVPLPPQIPNLAHKYGIDLQVGAAAGMHRQLAPSWLCLPGCQPRHRAAAPRGSRRAWRTARHRPAERARAAAAAASQVQGILNSQQVILGKEGQPIDLESYADQLLASCERRRGCVPGSGGRCGRGPAAREASRCPWASPAGAWLHGCARLRPLPGPRPRPAHPLQPRTRAWAC